MSKMNYVSAFIGESASGPAFIDADELNPRLFAFRFLNASVH